MEGFDWVLSNILRKHIDSIVLVLTEAEITGPDLIDMEKDDLIELGLTRV